MISLLFDNAIVHSIRVHLLGHTLLPTNTLSSFTFPRDLLVLYAVLLLTLRFFRLFRFLWTTFGPVRAVVPWARLAEEQHWVLVTGATDGIGKALVEKLVEKYHFNVVLVSRSQSKLSALADTLREKFGVQVRTLALDFDHLDDTDDERLQRIAKELKISILFNNVGVSHHRPTYFEEESMEMINRLIRVNVTGTLRVTKALLPAMLERHLGYIFTVGSFAGTYPTPLLQTYSGAKSFLSAWSLALSGEVASRGVHCELLNTYFVTSNMSGRKKPSWECPSADTFVQYVLQRVGRDSFSTPYPAHAFLHGVYSVMSPKVLLQQTLNMMRQVRTRALAKEARKTD